MPELDDSFLALPLDRLRDAALSRAAELGCSHADVRVERLRSGYRSLRDRALETSADTQTLGLSVRVVHEGVWGFAGDIALTVDSAARLAERAVATARVSKPLTPQLVELADEPVHADARWVSAYEVNPFDVDEAERQARLLALVEPLLAADGVTHANADLAWVQENKYFANLAGTTTTQQRVRVQAQLTAVHVGAEGFATMRTLAPPAGRGWEYLTGTGWDFDAEVAELPSLLAEHVAAPSVEAGRYDLVVDPSNLFLTIHESIGHATELDRALGYEAAYAGTSFATFDQLGRLQYGSPVMHVTGDRTAEHGLATIGFDDEGVAQQEFDIVRDGTLVGYQLNRQMAAEKQLGRSNGCAFADAPGHIPMQRMPNVSLQPAAEGPSTEDLVGRVERGLYVVGDKSWSIDMQRYNFQFTGQRFYRIEDGRLAGQVRDVAYQATTTDFWRSMEAVGGPGTYVLGGAFNCGKGQPGQVAPVSHGCPSALFRGVNILNTAAEGSQG
ncbi:TldD protein [Friedmanniella luteola]|uniref:TldD protein n=1 Tax=Friedmanniella luteola TaxID=546871 RepID=A0A1H1QYC2_9ACTN|nr:TldD/PmbA family protein [Friedmanniella luteola]SDS28383.1 TldD protein [Friedmanniella luteola]